MRTKKTYLLLQHSRGNHSATQVYWHGKTVLEGSKTACKKELVKMRKNCKYKFWETGTNDTLTDFIAYQMADIFFVEKQGNEIKFAY
jgi:hypothetical protein